MPLQELQIQTHLFWTNITFLSKSPKPRLNSLDALFSWKYLQNTLYNPQYLPFFSFFFVFLDTK